MNEVSCVRCGSTADGLDQAPLPGAIGAAVQAQVCGACWKAWMDAQVILMNEKRLSPGEPEHFAYLLGEMKTFLGLRSE